MNVDLKNSLILAVVGAIFGVLGFYGSQHYESENKKAEYKLRLTEKLYEDNYKATESLKKAIDGYVGLFANELALTSTQIEPKLENFNKSVAAYKAHLSELKRKGSTGQIEVAKNYLDWVYSIKSIFQLQYDMAAGLESRAADLLLMEDTNEEFLKSLDKAFDSELERLVRSENRLFYSIGIHKRNVLNHLEQYLNYQFRYQMGLDATLDMKKSIERLPEITEASNNFNFQGKSLPFAFASGRKIFAATLTLDEAGEIMELKNEALKNNSKVKFIAASIESNESLRKELQARKSSIEDGQANKKNQADGL